LEGGEGSSRKRRVGFLGRGGGLGIKGQAEVSYLAREEVRESLGKAEGGMLVGSGDGSDLPRRVLVTLYNCLVVAQAAISAL
jgi:hypothetical protein